MVGGFGSVTMIHDSVAGASGMKLNLAAGSGKNLIGPGDGLLLYYDTSKWIQAGGHA